MSNLIFAIFAWIFSYCDMKRKSRNRYLIAASAFALVIIGLFYYYFFSSFLTNPEKTYVYIDRDDTIDSVFAKVSPTASEHSLQGFKTLVRHSQYADHIRTGRYVIKPGQGAFSLFRHLKNGMQTPLDLVIPSVRTLNNLAGDLSKKLMMDSTELIQTLQDEATCKKYGYGKMTIACMFIPNTYDIYWNITPAKLLDRMQQESKKFWNDDRTAKAKQLKLSPVQVITVASIVDEETANDAEKPMVAGMYYNRLNYRDAEYPTGMPLQADPTIKFAWQRFELKRIYHNLLYIDSPYNTYKNVGLPPGPIRIPSVAGIDAVLNLVHHDYLYMCAKEDFSGTHNFAKTYAEHLQNAARYAAALNQRNIK